MLRDDAGTNWPWLGYELSSCRVGWIGTLIVTNSLKTISSLDILLISLLAVNLAWLGLIMSCPGVEVVQ